LRLRVGLATSQEASVARIPGAVGGGFGVFARPWTSGRTWLRNQSAAKSDGNSVCSTSRLELCEEMADVRLDRLFGQVKPLSDFPVDEPVGDELQHFELAGSRLLLELTQDGRSERDDGA
jgi:hypothetical protein